MIRRILIQYTFVWLSRRTATVAVQHDASFVSLRCYGEKQHHVALQINFETECIPEAAQGPERMTHPHDPQKLNLYDFFLERPGFSGLAVGPSSAGG